MLERRSFLKSLPLSAATLAAAGRAAGDAASSPPADPAAGSGPASDRFGELLPMRTLGGTGQRVTALALGGSHFLKEVPSQQSQAFADDVIAEGIRFIDTAEAYGQGRSETLIGKTFVPKYRDAIYLMSKTGARDAAEAEKDLADSLRRLNVDRIDCYQMHAIQNEDDVDRRLDQGVLDVLLKAQSDGKIGHLGFTGHNTPAAHLRMLARLDGMGLQLQTCQIPINVVDQHYASFIDRVLPELERRDYGVLAMKTLAFGQLLGRRTSWANHSPEQPKRVIPDTVSIEQALQFVWSHDAVSTLVSGITGVEELRQNAAALRTFKPMDQDQRVALVEQTRYAGGENMEFYKAPGVP